MSVPSPDCCFIAAAPRAAWMGFPVFGLISSYAFEAFMNSSCIRRLQLTSVHPITQQGFLGAAMA